MGCIGYHFVHHALDLGELLHEVDFIVQATSGIDDHDIGALCFGRLQRIKSHTCRVGTHALLYDRNANAVGPNDELVYGSCSKGVGGTQNYLESGLFHLVSKFANGSGFAYAIDAHNH